MIAAYVVVHEGNIFDGFIQGSSATWVNTLLSSKHPVFYNIADAKRVKEELLKRGYTTVTIHPVEIKEDAIDV